MKAVYCISDAVFGLGEAAWVTYWFVDLQYWYLQQTKTYIPLLMLFDILVTQLCDFMFNNLMHK